MMGVMFLVELIPKHINAIMSVLNSCFCLKVFGICFPNLNISDGGSLLPIDTLLLKYFFQMHLKDLSSIILHSA